MPEKANLPKVWVVSWSYRDNSDSGLIRAFDSEAKARDLLDLLVKHGGERDYCINPVEIEREYS